MLLADAVLSDQLNDRESFYMVLMESLVPELPFQSITSRQINRHAPHDAAYSDYSRLSQMLRRSIAIYLFVHRVLDNLDHFDHDLR
ncbi:MAG: hypothetical protein ACFWT5_14855 [Pseudomonas helleri]